MAHHVAAPMEMNPRRRPWSSPAMAGCPRWMLRPSDGVRENCLIVSWFWGGYKYHLQVLPVLFFQYMHRLEIFSNFCSSLVTFLLIEHLKKPHELLYGTHIRRSTVLKTSVFTYHEAHAYKDIFIT
uniref:Uncharacterized protein n=1 Tax=Oryza punctata TaxID=4537 RepID=A0A0E0LVL5_ORYPU